MDDLLSREISAFSTDLHLERKKLFLTNVKFLKVFCDSWLKSDLHIWYFTKEN